MPHVPDLAASLVAALPWILAPLVAFWRGSRSRSLDEASPVVPPDAPHLTVVVPARDEARNIEGCVRSILATTYPELEVVIVDDHSSDATPAIARTIAAVDDRVRVVAPPPLPQGWFGKPWACLTGARAASGEILLFVDADTRHRPDLLPRLVNEMRQRGADMLSVAGTQEMTTFWERLLQPQVFAMLGIRYGGTESVNRSRFAWDKIANGQCIAITRAAYESSGGHEAVRDCVAEDLMLAQRLFRGGYRTSLVLGVRQLSTRMYTSLGELVAGWRKNIFAGGIEGLPPFAPLRWLFPFLLPVFPLFQLVPLLALLAAVIGLGPPGVARVGAAIAVGATVAGWAMLYRRLEHSMLYALAYPLGAAVLLYIIGGAIARGRRVSWKGREYQAAVG
jgi:chlorobactene glucosyltransferase